MSRVRALYFSKLPFANEFRPQNAKIHQFFVIFSVFNRYRSDAGSCGFPRDGLPVKFSGLRCSGEKIRCLLSSESAQPRGYRWESHSNKWSVYGYYLTDFMWLTLFLREGGTGAGMWGIFSVEALPSAACTKKSWALKAG